MSATSLATLIKLNDPHAEPLAADETCEWVRSRFAIVGRVCVETKVSPSELRDLIDQRTAHAYAALDQLSESELSFADLWNLLLVIAVPWTRTEARSLPEIDKLLESTATDTSGSRKIILWADSSLEAHLGDLGHGNSISPRSGDPLRDSVIQVALSEEERNALEALFKRRIQDEDVDELIRVLGIKTKEQ
jgi:hypothetical protein